MALNLPTTCNNISIDSNFYAMDGYGQPFTGSLTCKDGEDITYEFHYVNGYKEGDNTKTTKYKFYKCAENINETLLKNVKLKKNEMTLKTKNVSLKIVNPTP